MKIKALCAAAVVTAVCAFGLSGCSGFKSYEPQAPNLAKGATYEYSYGKSSSKMKLSAKGESYVTVKFDKATTFNTVMLKSKADNIEDFEILIGDESVYRQDEIGDARSCWLGNRTASELTIKVLKADGAYSVNFLGVYDMPRERDFNVTTYLETGKNCERLDGLDAESLSRVDNVILFNSDDFAFTDEGKLAVNRASLEKALGFVRGANPDVSVTLCLLPKAVKPENAGLPWPYNVAKTHSDAFLNGDAFIAEIKALLDEYALAGVGFDYEYPQSGNDWKSFSDFIIKLKSSLGDKKLSLAIQYNGGNLSKKAMAVVDDFEIMCYDFVGKNKSHSTFHDAITMTLGLLKSAGHDLSRVNIGLPFYSRPQEQSDQWSLVPYWGEYKEYYKKLGKFSNVLELNEQRGNVFVKSLYFNSYQMIADKTAFLYDYGVGGVMIWNYGSDAPYSDPLSLHRAVRDALGDQ